MNYGWEHDCTRCVNTMKSYLQAAQIKDLDRKIARFDLATDLSALACICALVIFMGTVIHAAAEYTGSEPYLTSAHTATIVICAVVFCIGTVTTFFTNIRFVRLKTKRTPVQGWILFERDADILHIHKDYERLGGPDPGFKTYNAITYLRPLAFCVDLADGGVAEPRQFCLDERGVYSWYEVAYVKGGWCAIYMERPGYFRFVNYLEAFVWSHLDATPLSDILAFINAHDSFSKFFGCITASGNPVVNPAARQERMEHILRGLGAYVEAKKPKPISGKLIIETIEEALQSGVFPSGLDDEETDCLVGGMARITAPKTPCTPAAV